jgi:hypothetical protein
MPSSLRPNETENLVEVDISSQRAFVAPPRAVESPTEREAARPCS